MKLLFITQYFPPEFGAASARMFEFADMLSKRGHKVFVVTGFPNYPSSEEYKTKRYFRILKREKIRRINVIRTFILSFRSKNFITRILNYASFSLSAIIGTMLVGRTDVVITSSPPLFVGIPGVWYSIVRGVPLVFDVRDIWPEIAVLIGELTNAKAIKWAEKLEIFIYGKADTVTVVSDRKRGKLISKGVPPSKIEIIRNGVDCGLFDPEKHAVLEMELSAKYNPENKFLVLYSGNFGIAQGLETILECANILREHIGILFVLVGDGVRKGVLLKMRDQLNLENVMFVETQKKELMPALVGIADVGLVVLRKCGLVDSVPSKMFEYMAMGKPVILASEGESADVLEKSGGGVTVPPEDPQKLADTVVLFYNNMEKMKKYGYNGREYVRINYDRKWIVDKFEELLKKYAEDK